MKRHLIVVFGPAGCGKSTMGFFLAREKNCVFLEGDLYHPQSNKEKMSARIPLTDHDRAGWLKALSSAAIEKLFACRIVIVSCSALKRKYRDVFRNAVKQPNVVNSSLDINFKKEQIKLHFLFPDMPQSKATELVEIRQKLGSHFMPPTLVESQYKTLELPDEDELDCFRIDANRELEEVKEEALRILESLLGE